ncbi:putative replication protein A, subunit RPA32 [Lyophyllum shimeji]|uniref:Replication protein A, subunit RPA32 n=1 Tax=Lyophyllum shimeji TaxID=47721 RepID=A0A9P3PF79_LYOSH|nr:putative replication protein A, subunit RPA32 [Lyophyllum shimeji]
MSQYGDIYGGGGGFLQGGSPYSASGSPSGGRNKEASHSLRPLTVAQLLKATQAHADAEWTVDEAEIGQVTIVGQVVTIQSQTTNCVYWIDDGTGRIEARHWVDSTSEEDSAKWGGIEETKYVRVTGTLKTFGNKRYINATHIRGATDPHELYFHILEAITITLMVDRGSSSAASASGAAASAYTSPQAVSSAPDEYSHLPPLQQKIIRFISAQPRSDEGVHVSSIARATGTQGDAEKISDALDKLMDEGLVYSTIDDSHFNLST